MAPNTDFKSNNNNKNQLKLPFKNNRKGCLGLDSGSAFLNYYIHKSVCVCVCCLKLLLTQFVVMSYMAYKTYIL